MNAQRGLHRADFVRARHEHDLHAGMKLDHALGELTSVHERHAHVGQEQINLAPGYDGTG